MITKFKIYEGVQYGKLYQVLKDIHNGDLDIDAIEDYIDFKFNYEFDSNDYIDNSFDVVLNEEDLENLVGIENGTIGFIQQLTSAYGDYNYDVSDTEMEYINQYLSGDTKEYIEKLSKYVSIDIDVNKEGEISYLFEELGLNELIDDCLSEIRMEHERAIDESATNAVDSIPFNIGSPSYSWRRKKFDCELTFEIGGMIDHIEENNMSVDTVKDFVENTDFGEWSYEILHDHHEELGDFSELNSVVYNQVESYVSSPDELLVEFVKNDKLDLFKKLKKDADYIGEYTNWVNNDRKNLTLFGIAIIKNNSFLEYFKSYEFQKWYMSYNNNNEEKVNRYRQLVKDEIINDKIVNDYEYIIDAEKFNL